MQKQEVKMLKENKVSLFGNAMLALSRGDHS